MSAHVSLPPIDDADAWPSVDISRQPNGRLGVRIVFPMPPALREQLGVEEFGMNMEPQRARRLRDHLTAHLKELGFDT
jgi:hypothetical protein